MSTETVTAKLGKEADAPSYSVNYDFGENLDAAIEKFGEDVIFQKFKANTTIDLQALIRRNVGGDNPKTEEELQSIVNEWRPGVQKPRKSAKDKALAALDSMSDEDRAALIAQLTAG